MKPIWVIVEGPDGAGKSYVAKECAHILASHGGSQPERPCVLQKLSYDSPRNHYVDYPAFYRRMDAHVVQDRGALSGPVYEPIMRNDLERLAWLDQLVWECVREGAVIIHVDADSHVLEERLEARGDDYITVDKLLDIQAGYHAIMKNWAALGGLSTRLDTTETFPDRLQLELILSAFATRQR